MPRVICPNCSNPYTPPSAGPERCPRCGYGAGGDSAPAPVPVRMSSTAASTFSPTISPPGPGLAPPGSPLAPPALPQTNGFAVTSMVLGIVTFPMFFFAVILAPLAVVFGIVGITQIRSKGQRGLGMAVTGVILGSIMILLGFALFGMIMPFL